MAFVTRAATLSEYNFVGIDVPDSQSTVARGINDRGQIVGQFFPTGGGTGGFLFSHGTYVNIDPQGTHGVGSANGINARGQIVGVAQQAGVSEGFLDTNGTFTSIAVPGALATDAAGINARGQIVGAYTDQPFSNFPGGVHGFLDTDGTFTSVNVPGALGIRANGINDWSGIVGDYFDTTWHGFLDVEGTFIRLDIAGAVQTHAQGINDRGQIVGWYEDSAGISHGFLTNFLAAVVASGENASSTTSGSLADIIASEAGHIALVDLISGYFATAGRLPQPGSDSASQDPMNAEPAPFAYFGIGEKMQMSYPMLHPAT